MQFLVHQAPSAQPQIHPACWYWLQVQEQRAVLASAGLQLYCQCNPGGVTHSVKLWADLHTCYRPWHTAGVSACRAAVLVGHKMQGYKWLQTTLLKC